MARAFRSQLRDRELPTQFAGLDFEDLKCDQLGKLIKLFDPNARGFSKLPKILLVQRLVQLKPRPLKRAERLAVGSIRDGNTIEQARALLPPPSVHKFRKLRSDWGRRREPSHNYARAASSTQKAESKGSSTPTSFPTPVASAIGYYPSAAHFVRSPNDWLSGFTKPLTKECQTCLDQLAIINFPVLPRDASCQHKETTMCNECLSNYIEAQASSSALYEIRCPEPNCTATLGYNHMKKYAPAHIFARYDSFLNSKALENIEDYVECAGKTCHFAWMVDISVTTYVTCSNCDTRTCTTCRTSWHPELSHDENMGKIRRAAEEEEAHVREETRRAEEEEQRARDEVRKAGEELETSKTVQVKTKACPSKRCGVRIQKNGGCDHMTCKSHAPRPCLLPKVDTDICYQGYSCRHEFCWLCFASYDQIRRHDNHHHNQGCKHFRPLPSPQVVYQNPQTVQPRPGSQRPSDGARARHTGLTVHVLEDYHAGEDAHAARRQIQRPRSLLGRLMQRERQTSHPTHATNPDTAQTAPSPAPTDPVAMTRIHARAAAWFRDDDPPSTSSSAHPRSASKATAASRGPRLVLHAQESRTVPSSSSAATAPTTARPVTPPARQRDNSMDWVGVDPAVTPPPNRRSYLRRSAVGDSDEDSANDEDEDEDLEPFR